MTTVEYTVPNISCGHCVATIEREVKELTGVQSVKASNETKQVAITFDAPTDEKSIKELLAEIGYPAQDLIAL